jgi:hypothetical protein
MTTEALVDNSKIEVICRECGNTLLAPELAEFFNEEQLILNFWSCSNIDARHWPQRQNVGLTCSRVLFTHRLQLAGHRCRARCAATRHLPLQ